MFFSACGDSGPLADLFQSDSPYEEYLHDLKSSDLKATALAQDFEEAGRRALESPVAAQLPFRETGYFAPHTPAAVAYRFELRRGRKLVIEIILDSDRPGRLFVDLFRIDESDSARRVASLPRDTTVLEYGVRRNATYLLRVQPELLRGGRFTIVQRTEASVDFPVPGRGLNAVRSRFGAERDAGRRTHHGVDIFAPRGTPAVAVADGPARAGTNELGGNVVWLYDTREGRRYYYAHLDRWAIDEKNVKAGDTLGFIGNTGNARTTPPHLHFGIYDGGPVDPEPFFAPDDPEPSRIAAPVERLDQWIRISRDRVVLRDGSHRSADTVRSLPKDWLARVTGASRSALRVHLPDRSVGYVLSESVTAAAEPIGTTPLDSGTVIRDAPFAQAPVVDQLRAGTVSLVLGRFGEFQLVRLGDDRFGWVARSVSGER